MNAGVPVGLSKGIKACDALTTLFLLWLRAPVTFHEKSLFKTGTAFNANSQPLFSTVPSLVTKVLPPLDGATVLMTINEPSITSLLYQVKPRPSLLLKNPRSVPSSVSCALSGSISGLASLVEALYVGIPFMLLAV